MRENKSIKQDNTMKILRNGILSEFRTSIQFEFRLSFLDASSGYVQLSESTSSFTSVSYISQTRTPV